MRIMYKSPKEFEKFVTTNKLKEVGTNFRYTFKDRVTSPEAKFSQYSNTCSIVGINDTLVHLAPEIHQYNFFKKFEEFLQKEKDVKGCIEAMVCGGRIDSPDSQTLFYGIGNMLEKFGAEFSMIGMKNGKSKGGLDALAQSGDTFVFTQEYNRALQDSMQSCKDKSTDGLRKILEQFYDYIEISPKHEIIV